MKQSYGKKFLSFGIISIAAASLLYADTTLEMPPGPGNSNGTTIEMPPAAGQNGGDNNTSNENNNTNGGEGDHTHQSCDYGSYYNPMLNDCTSIKPLTLLELKNGVWLDIVVDKDTKPPTPTDDISGCTSITDSINSSDLNITHMFKDENNETRTESSSWANYDEATGKLEMSFPREDDNDDSHNSAAGTSSDNHSEKMFVSKEDINGTQRVFLVREEYFDGRYEMFIDGLIENSTGTCADVQNDLIFENDYFNPNVDMDITISGDVILPSDIEAHNVHINAIKSNWEFVSGSELDEFNNNHFTLGFNEAEDVAIRVNINTPNQWFEFYYTPADGLMPVDWNKPLDDYTFNVSESLENVDINITEFFENQVTLEGTATFESSDNISIEFIDMASGSYFGWQELQDSGDFSALALNGEPGSKYVMKINKYADDHSDWESYFASLDENNETKLIPDTNIEWNSYEVDENGTLTPVEHHHTDSAGDMTNGHHKHTIWLPDFEKTGYIEVPENGDVPDININLTDDAIDSQFYIVEGNVTLPQGFKGHVSFEATDKNSGEWLGWSEYDRDSNSYKLKFDMDRDILVRVNYEEESNGAYNYSSYFLKPDGSLVSDKNIEYTPILKDWDGNDLVELDKTFDKCIEDNNFWYQEPGSEDGICYNNHPNNWTPNSDQTGFLSWEDDNKKLVYNLDFAQMEANVYKLEGTITLPSGFTPNHDWQNRRTIMIEAIDKNTGTFLGTTSISDKPVQGTTNEYAYSLRLEGVMDYSDVIVRLIKEDNSADDGKNWESFYLEFDDESNIIGFIPEETVQWKENKDQDGNEYWIPDTSSFHVAAIADNYEDRILDLNIDYTVILANYESNRLAIKGNITLTDPVTLGQTSDYHWNNVRVEIINSDNGDWINSRDAICSDLSNNACTTLTFDIDIPDSGNYTVKVVKEIDGVWEEFYYNFGADHDVNGTEDNSDRLINGQNVEWVEAKEYPSWGGSWKNWLPNPEQTGYITMTKGGSGQKELDIDFNQFEDMRLSLEGKIDLGFNFVPGEYCTNGTDDSIKRCEWTKPENEGYNEWYGSKYARVEVISKDTGEFVASTDLRKRLPNTNEYEYKLDLGDKNGVKDFIVKLTKESSSDGKWNFKEIYYNFGSDHAIGTTGDETTEDKLINGKKVMWQEAETANHWGYKNWMPNPEETGYISMTDTIEDFNIDTSLFGQNDKKISGVVTFKDDFNISAENSFADISAIDAKTGMWVGNAPVNDDGSFEINLGEEAGEFILQINYSYNDYQNWENSWWKNKYYDFGSDKVQSEDDQLLNEMDVRWEPVLGDPLDITNEHTCWQKGNFWDYDNTKACYEQPEYWRPNVNPLEVQNSVSGIEIDLSKTIGSTLNISITNLPQNAKDAYVYVVDPLTYNGIWQNLVDGNTTISEVRDGNYTIEFGYNIDGTWEHKHFFIKDDDGDLTNGTGAVPGNEVSWEEIDSDNEIWGPNPNDTTYANVDEDMNISISIPEITYNKVDISLSNISNNTDVSVDFRSLDKPYGRWEQLNSGSDTNVSASFDDVRDGNYILSFWYDGSEYTANETNGSVTLVKDPEWVAKKDTNNDGSLDTVVCGGDAGWNCTWSESRDWVWMPNVNPLMIENNETLALSAPVLPKVSGSIDLDSEFAGQNVYVSIFKHNGNDWNWKDFTLDTNGDVNGSITVSGGDDYRIEVWIDGLGGYVYSNNGTPTDSSDDKWITQMNSWDNTTWMPKDETLIDINDDLNLGTISVGENFNKVTVELLNLGENEDVWISLESDTQGYFGEGNVNWETTPVTYDSNITLKVPASDDYKLLVFASNHSSGYASDSDSDGDLDKLSWAVAGDTINIDSAKTLTVELSSASLGDINGTVNCGAEDCSGWIDAFDSTNYIGKGAMVNADGTFTIKGLETGTYDVSYWGNNGVMLLQEGVSVTADETETISLVKEAASTFESVSGTVTADDLSGVYMVLVKVSGSDFEVINTAKPDESGAYSFGSVQKTSSGKSLVVAAAKIFRDDTLKQNVVKFDELTEVYDADGTVDLPSVLTEDFVTSITATAQAAQ